LSRTGSTHLQESNMTVPSTPAASRRVLRMHIPERAAQIGMSVRAADQTLGLDGGHHGLLDTTHFDTVRFPPPPWAAAAFAEAAASGELAYTAYRGHPQVRDQLARMLSPVLGVPLSGAENIALTPGTQAGLFATLSALVDEGDLVLTADPDYLFNERILAFLGARVRRIGVVRDSTGTHLDLDALEQACAERPRLLLFSHPSNPTGAVYSAETLDRLAQLAREWDFRVVVDSLYCRLIYDNAPFAHLMGLPGMAERCVTLLGPSKTESLSGYRIGVTIGPPDILEAIELVLAASCLRAPAYAQQLLKHWWVDDIDFVDARVKELRIIRDLTLEHFERVPYLRVSRTQATAYLFPDISALKVTDQQVAARLQRDARVIVSPGYQFGPSGVGHFRVCYARDENEWERALIAMVDALRDLGREQGTSLWSVHPEGKTRLARQKTDPVPRRFPMNVHGPVKVLIASPLEPEYVERIAATDSRIEVLYAPELLPLTRYEADHHGPPRDLTAAQLEQWQSLLSMAQVSFDFDWRAPKDLAVNCPNLKWVQASSSGIGQFIERTGLGKTDITFTTAAGVHAVPLAEFALTGMLYFVKELPELADRQRAHNWERYTTRLLAGRRVLVIGLGQVGTKVAEVFSAMGVEVWAAVPDAKAVDCPAVSRAVDAASIDEVLPDVHGVILCCPLTPQTAGLLDRRRLRLLPAGAIIVNVGRGAVIEEPAMIEGLADGHLGGAFLDVATVEPLPSDSPLWDMRNVVISPHSASTVGSENAAITDLFCDNLQRWLAGAPLRNVYSWDNGY
jgi:aspartate/methionine/tyrosine aminotransferase/phosphoglycerate dehydrogenase-like enzyme